MHRRYFLTAASVLLLPARLWASEKPLTPSQTEGPFYPVVPLPLRENLIKNEAAVKNEGFLRLSGQVVDTRGKAQHGLRVEIWQCDGNGVYDHPSQPGHNRFDRHFLGFGATQTGPEGEYLFNTLMPVPYTGRPPHIHAKIWRDKQELLTTQLYLKGNTGRSFFSNRRQFLQIDPVKVSEGRSQR